MIKLMIVDDHPVMIDGIKSVLKNEHNIKIMDALTNESEVLKLLKTKIPDIILIDASMKEMKGINTGKHIKKKFPFVKILFMSQFEDRWVIKKCLDAGADGYINKNVSKEELIEAIHLVDKGELKFFHKEGLRSLAK